MRLHWRQILDPSEKITLPADAYKGGYVKEIAKKIAKKYDDYVTKETWNQATSVSLARISRAKKCLSP